MKMKDYSMTYDIFILNFDCLYIFQNKILYFNENLANNIFC